MTGAGRKEEIALESYMRVTLYVSPCVLNCIPGRHATRSRAPVNQAVAGLFSQTSPTVHQSVPAGAASEIPEL